MSTLVIIPECTATQLLPGTSVLLADGPLDLLQDEDSQALTMKIGSLAFPLPKDTPFFTHAENPLWYFFRIAAVEDSFVRITMPQGVAKDDSEEQKLRDRFEAILIEAGLLKSGISAAGDEVGAGFRDDASKLAEVIKSQVSTYTGSHAPTAEPATFNPAVHSVASRAAAGSATIAGYAASAAEAFAKATIGLGEKVVDIVHTATSGPVDRSEKFRQDLAEAGYSADEMDEGAGSTIKPAAEATKAAASGIGGGVAEVASAAREGAHSLIQHSYGDEAAELSTKVGETSDHLGAAAKSILVDTSPVKIAIQAASNPDSADG